MTETLEPPDVYARTKTILENLTLEEQQLCSKVLAAERDKLYMQKPRGINEELWRILTEIVK